MIRKETERLRAYQHDAEKFYMDYVRLLEWLKVNHPEVRKEYEDGILFKIIKG